MRALPSLLLVVALLALSIGGLGVHALHGEETRPAAAAAAAALQPAEDTTPLLHHAVTEGSHATVLSRSASKRVTAFPALGSLYHSTGDLYREVAALGARCAHLTLKWEYAGGGSRKSLLTARVNLGGGKKKERALFLFGEHAREMISPEVGLELLRRLCDPKQRHAKMAGVGATIEQVLQSTEFLIFPNANPSGRRITERGNYCNRVNDRGVDLNRNWGEHWSARSRHADTFPGAHAWSEGEVQIMARVATEFHPTIFISIHSGSLHMLSPFAFKSTLGGEPAASKSAIDPPGIKVDAKVPDTDTQAGEGLRPVLQVLRKVNQDFCRCAVGAAGKLLGYLSPGTCLDYLYNRLGVRYAFALEIYSGKSYAHPRNSRHARRSSSLLELTAAADSDAEVDEADALEYDAAEAAEQAALAEIDSEFFELADAADAEGDDDAEGGAALTEMRADMQSVPLPAVSLAELETVAASHPNDASIPENRAGLFPRPTSHRARRCLTGFNPVTPLMFRRTTDHWARGLLAFVSDIQQARAASAAEAKEADDE